MINKSIIIIIILKKQYGLIIISDKCYLLINFLSTNVEIIYHTQSVISKL